MSSLLRLCMTLCVVAPALAYSTVLENPSNGLAYSGIGVVSGWKCESAGPLTVRFHDAAMTPLGDVIPLAYRNERPDTAGVCGDTNNGFVAIWNWANLGDGTYTAVVDDNGVEFGRSTFTVTTLGEAFSPAYGAECTIDDFPSSGESARFAWNQATQGLVLIPEPPALAFPLRALHAAGRWGTNHRAVEAWEATGRTGPLIPPDYIAWLQSLHVNWIGVSVGLHYDDSMDSTVERVYSGVEVLTYADDVLRQMIREFHSHGINVYLTLAFEAHEAEASTRPVRRWELGDPGDQRLVSRILPKGSYRILAVAARPSRPPTVCHRVLGDLLRSRRCILPALPRRKVSGCTHWAQRRTGFSARGPEVNAGPMISARNFERW